MILEILDFSKGPVLKTVFFLLLLHGLNHELSGASDINMVPRPCMIVAACYGSCILCSLDLVLSITFLACPSLLVNCLDKPLLLDLLLIPLWKTVQRRGAVQTR